MRKKGFTLVELLNVIAIIAVLTAIFFPALIAARKVVYRYGAALSMKNLGSAVEMYLADHDDTYPLASSWDGSTYRAWYGLYEGPGKWNDKEGILSSYTRGRAARDLMHFAKDFMGDQSGFGYNWGYVGSDLSITGYFDEWPNCYRPARGTELNNPKGTTLFATSVYYFARWLPKGDGLKHDYGFVNPPKFWNGIPTVDFRHGDQPIVDEKNRKVTPKGYAVFLFSSGRIRSMSPDEVTDEIFERTLPEEPY